MSYPEAREEELVRITSVPASVPQFSAILSNARDFIRRNIRTNTEEGDVARRLEAGLHTMPGVNTNMMLICQEGDRYHVIVDGDKGVVRMWTASDRVKAMIKSELPKIAREQAEIAQEDAERSAQSKGSSDKWQSLVAEERESRRQHRFDGQISRVYGPGIF